MRLESADYRCIRFVRSKACDLGCAAIYAHSAKKGGNI